MADFEAPTGPPPPKVPEGWVARWNDQYKEWFYVNTYTKKSQWEKPTEPAIPPRDDLPAPAGPPPSYTPGDSKPSVSDAKVNPYDTNPSQHAGGASSSSHNPQESEDERLARQLQAEEDARARSHGGTTPQPNQQFPGQLPPRPDNLEKGKSFLGKLFGGAKKPSGSHGSSSGGGLAGSVAGLMANRPGSHSHGGGGYPGGYGGPAPPPQGYGGYPPQGGYGGYPPQQPGYGGYPPQPGYGGYAQQPGYGGYGGYPQQGYGAHGRPTKSGPGMGMMAGGAALGVGAGLLGGALVADAIHDNQQEAYQEGYQDGAGGDDFGGGDFGGDF
ncbi:hypothetical protein B0T21DRAFT_369306 [Apiosordaria backusii]|uniref:WW domain-containing protein n=1 Tax=Apiosordaria backusii TaxID=314023 RepID=A0AA40BE64_9PEZI|nr:hypothetical protein B0T21DRAFT_369306 [Apiosordaria backusii]